MEALKAAENGNLTSLKRLLDAEPSLIHYADRDGYGCLHRAAYSNHIPVIEELIQRGADVNKKTKDGWEPLHSAVRWNNFTVASILLHSGSDPNNKTTGENTTLHVASFKQTSPESLLLLLWWPFSNCEAKNISGDTPLDIAKRNVEYHGLFEAKEDSINVI